MRNIGVLVLLVFSIGGCSTFATFNDELPDDKKLKDNRAQFTIENDHRGNKDTLFILALSGGGSRAAYLSSQVMLALQTLELEKGTTTDLLAEVDAISSVSGGSLPAAYYAISRDPQDDPKDAFSNRIWNRETVEELMSKNYIVRWILNWFWPDNIALYWATAYDRSDIMSQTFADNLFDVRFTGKDLRFKHINKKRPYIILNSTSGTILESSGTPNEEGGDYKFKFGDPFTFTHDDFKKINSDISEYEISRAVMASASFPAVFNYMTLLDHSKSKDDKDDKHIHVFDGGNVDNLGLNSTNKIIAENNKYQKVVVLLVDAFTEPQGVPNRQADALAGVDYAIDFNFLDSTDSLLRKVRNASVDDTKRLVEKLNKNGKRAIFYHLSFEDIATKKYRDAEVTFKEIISNDFEDESDDGNEEIEKNVNLSDALNSISTNFSISDNNTAAIKKAVELLINKENECLRNISSLINTPSFVIEDSYCRWPTRKKNGAIANNN